MENFAQIALLSAATMTAVAVPVRQAATQPALQVQVSSGTATDQRGVRSAAVTVAPMLTLRESAHSTLALFGSGTQFAQSAHSLSAGTSAMVRTSPVSRVGASLMADASYTSTSFAARFVNAQAAPMLEWRPGALSFAAGMRAAYGSTSFVVAGPDAPNGGLGGLLGRSSSPASPTGSRVMQARTLWGPQAQASAYFSARDGRAATRMALGYGAWRDVRVGSGTQNGAVLDPLHDVTLSTAFAAGPVTVQGLLGRRLPSGAGDRAVSDFGSAQLDLALSRVLTVTAGGGSYLADPVSGALGGRFLTAGLSVKFGGAGRITGGAASPSQMPAVRDAAAPARGTTRLVIRAPRASSVQVAGDWNSWQRQSAHRARDGVWYVDVALEPGEYRYAFLIDGSEWRVPEHAVTGDDGLGGKVAWISVRTSAR